jgi:hypothetical protein
VLAGLVHDARAGDAHVAARGQQQVHARVRIGEHDGASDLVEVRVPLALSDEKCSPGRAVRIEELRVSPVDPVAS